MVQYHAAQKYLMGLLVFVNDQRRFYKNDFVFIYKWKLNAVFYSFQSKTEF